MEIFAYGEDALTLWAVKYKLPAILDTLKDHSSPEKCQVFFRPSFGRSGGKGSSQFGEFDFILLSQYCLYLGESKWDRSSEKIKKGILNLRSEQQLRHDLFRFYVEEWAFGSYETWRDFEQQALSKLELRGIKKPLAPKGSLLTSNLQTVLGIIKRHYTSLPEIRNVLLYLHNGALTRPLPQTAGKDFEVVAIDYAAYVFDYFIKIEV